MRRTALFRSGLVLALALAGCQDQITAPSPELAPVAADLALQPGSPSFSFERSAIELPAGALATDLTFADAFRDAIDSGDYVCPASTPISDWWLGEALDAYGREPEIFELLYFDLLADVIPTYDALLFQTEDTPQYFGYDGEYTKIMIKTERDAKRFWDIPSDDIQLIGMHGTMLLDFDRVAATYEAVFGLSPADAEFVAGLVVDAMERSEALNGGDHPLFSFNAFAFTTFGGSIPDKIVMGDGILAGYEALGFADVAPQAIYAHEFAHHIQYENGYFEDEYATAGDAPEQTRYTELMADAMSAYYLTHKRGAAMNRKRVEKFLEVFYQIGDCAFSNDGHHGTPNQRMAAARFGFEVAAGAQKQGHILSSEEFYQLFFDVYPDIIAPDAPAAP